MKSTIPTVKKQRKIFTKFDKLDSDYNKSKTINQASKTILKGESDG